MFQFNIGFLLKTTVICAIGCMPILLDPSYGYLWTATLLPSILIATIAFQFRANGDRKIDLVFIKDSLYEIREWNGFYQIWMVQARLIGLAVCLIPVVNFPLYHMVEPGPIELWLPLSLVFAYFCLMMIAQSTRSRIETEYQQLFHDYLLFGRIRYWRTIWRVQPVDQLKIVTVTHSRYSMMKYSMRIVATRGKTERVIFQTFTPERVCDEMASITLRIANEMGIEFIGYRDNDVENMPEE